MTREQAIENIVSAFTTVASEFCSGESELRDNEIELRDSLRALGVLDGEMPKHLLDLPAEN